ncbi:MAG: Rpn family recombination-promoting nuclease/putative transposase [Paludibacteraceae bacterium]|nr:Rpn family recombination-promoting nuclease/putative transposase [Paludibacteraceae bacterium]
MCIPGTAMSRYINFYTDFAFKKIFGTEANKDLLISFLNCLLELKDGKEITDLTYMNSEQLGESAGERRAIYDVYCKTAADERFIVEMQKAEQDHFIDRSIYYSSFAIREQSQKGAVDRKLWDYSLSPVYVVGILNFEMDETMERADKVMTRVKLKDDENRDFSDKLNFIFLEMPKFRKVETELETLMDKWLYVIKNLYQLENKPASLTEGIFRKLFDVAEIAAFTKEERYDYEESLKNFRDLYNTISTAEKKGRAEGRAEGEKEERLRNAKNFKQLGVDLETIAKATGLSVEEIEKL